MSEIEAGADSIRKFLHELDIRIRARYPLIAINTFEEDRIREALVDLVFQERHKEKPLFSGAVQAVYRRSLIRKRDY
ncbi:MAG: hypothetical protein IPP63_20550 [Chloracidobacterium sp.]|nr:hypothetical protein [Chloracidobacterium sp.]